MDLRLEVVGKCGSGFSSPLSANPALNILFRPFFNAENAEQDAEAAKQSA